MRLEGKKQRPAADRRRGAVPAGAVARSGVFSAACGWWLSGIPGGRGNCVRFGEFYISIRAIRAIRSPARAIGH